LVEFEVRFHRCLRDAVQGQRNVLKRPGIPGDVLVQEGIDGVPVETRPIALSARSSRSEAFARSADRSASSLSAYLAINGPRC
jgi:hypothetical protein